MLVSPRQLLQKLLPPSRREKAVKAAVEPIMAPDRLVRTVRAISGPLRLKPAEAKALGKALAKGDEAAIDAVALPLAGDFVPLPGNRYASLKLPNATVTASEEGRLLRVDAGAQTAFYRDGKLSAKAHAEEGVLVVTRRGREERWDLKGIAATIDGKALEVPAARRIPGEAPRGPWAAQPNRFVFPAAEANAVTMDDLAKFEAFATKLDANEVAIGAKVIEPTSRTFNYQDPDVFNCHSWGLTGGEGNLANPFDSLERPRWVASPMFELTDGKWTKLAPDQRAHVGDRILYRKDGAVTHTGVVAAVDGDGNPSMIRSKWGNWGLFEHQPFDVPNVPGSDYGLPAELYRAR